MKNKDFNEKEIQIAIDVFRKLERLPDNPESRLMRGLFANDNLENIPQKSVNDILADYVEYRLLKNLTPSELLAQIQGKNQISLPSWLEAALNCKNPEERAAWAIAEYLSEISLEEEGGEK